MTLKYLDKYADLLLILGINLRKGQCITISGEMEHYDFLIMLSERAYQLGAKYVNLEITHPRNNLNRLTYVNIEDLGYVPSHMTTYYQTMVDEGWSTLAIRGSSDPYLLKNVDTKKSQITTAALATVAKPYTEARNSKLSWTLASLPTEGWGKQVLGNDVIDAKEKLWEILIPILKLDHADPIQAWKQHLQILTHRKDALNSHQFKSVHFKSKRTDLTMDLISNCQWIAAYWSSLCNGMSMPNIPTEEVFTTPHSYSVNGHVASTRPVDFQGHIVEDIVLHFKDGKVIEASAKKGEDMLHSYLKTDAGASRLGEVALVDTSSKIYQANKLFHDILYDENASCHIALGRGYIMGFADVPKKPFKEYMPLGVNDSLVHTDIMIGDDDLQLLGTKADGKQIEIMKNGRFTPEFT